MGARNESDGWAASTDSSDARPDRDVKRVHWARALKLLVFVSTPSPLPPYTGRGNPTLASPSMIRFTCPICQDVVQVSEHLAGLSTRCPLCKATVDVPEHAVTAAPPRPRE